MREQTLFVSDVHLTPARADIERLFRRFLAERAAESQALYILGDLFEYWAGDDDLTDRFNAAVTADLARCARSGVKVFFIPGNRDFLVGERFARGAAITLLRDPTLVDLYGRRTLLSHGDELCTDDSSYQQFRARVRSSTWQNEFLARPLEQRRREIEALRAQSEREKRIKPAAIMDVNESSVEDLLRRHGYPDLIHGHTHRAARKEHPIDGYTCVRWVLADWYESGSWLAADRNGMRAERF